VLPTDEANLTIPAFLLASGSSAAMASSLATELSTSTVGAADRVGPLPAPADPQPAVANEMAKDSISSE
jgi:hypothetical protein